MKRNTFDVDEALEEQLSIKDLKRVLDYIKPYKSQVFIALIIILIANFATLIGPFLVMQAIDNAIPNGDIPQLMTLAIIFLISVIISGLCVSYRIKNIAKIGQNALRDMRLELFTHLQQLSFDFFDSRPHGKILIRVVNYINTLSDLLSNGLINLISDLFSLVIAFGFMLHINVRFTLFSLMFVPILFALAFFIKTMQRKNFQTLSNKQSNMNAYIHESIAGIKTSQSFVREKENTDIFDNVQTDYRSAWLRAIGTMFLMQPAVHNVQVLATALIYFLGAHAIGDQTVTIGVVIAFIGYLGNFWNPIVNIGNFYNALVTGSAYLERIFETIDETPAVMDVPDAFDMPSIVGDIVFDNVRFGYEDIEILKGLSFNVKAGESIALVGPTGAGKSTIINLVSRFYNIDAGTISIDGQNISQVKLHSLRSQMGVMLQDTFIFSGTIMDNIRYGKLDATEAEIIAAAKAVQAHDFIMNMKDGYETEINERGSNLSAGQRQLLSFARTLLADPKILILDEATASIDTKTEALLQTALDRLLEGRTSFIIAHRLSTIKNASRIFYISNGILQEAGSHHKLMEIPDGHYRKLYESQFARA
ncbi:MAG: ABC transporter ATP-binding protein/permease [Defluviitaleaceae bacterium]|nr:ABC transporter ATP-binding protein/permease [Defluviitaleaceae bacterium]